MITVRRDRERHHLRRARQDLWLTFRPHDQADPLAEGFGALALFNEDHLQPGQAIASSSRPAAR